MPCRQMYILLSSPQESLLPWQWVLYLSDFYKNDVNSFNDLRFKFVGTIKVTVIMATVQILKGTVQCTKTKVYYKTY